MRRGVTTVTAQALTFVIEVMRIVFPVLIERFHVELYTRVKGDDRLSTESTEDGWRVPPSYVTSRVDVQYYDYVGHIFFV